MLDSRQECLSLPNGLYSTIIDNLKEHLSYTEEHPEWGELFHCEEIDKLPDIELLFGGYWLESKVDDYVYNFDGDTCAFCIKQSTTKAAAFGSAVLSGYFIIHDKPRM